MAVGKMQGIQALAFDTGGTVLDWHAGISAALAAGAAHGLVRDWPAITNETAFVHRPAEWGEAGSPDLVSNPGLDLVAPNFPTLADALGA